MAMAGLDQALEVFVPCGVAVVEMPRCNVERTDTGFPPSRGEVIRIGSRAVRIIEERPQVGTARRGFKSKVSQRLHQVRKAFIAVLTGRRGNPQNRAGTDSLSGDQWRGRPAILREDARRGGHIVTGEFGRAL